jgi:hypothetical protein
MKIHAFVLVAVAGLAAASGSSAQSKKVQLGGTWKAETPDGPRSVIIRADSSASYGDETVRWRLKGDSIHIAFGDEWMVYRYKVKGSRLTLSGGDLDEPITLKRVGAATPLPKGTIVPPAPPASSRGTGAPVGTRSRTG